MKKIIISVLVIAAVVGIGIFLLKNNDKNSDSNSSNSSTNTADVTPSNDLAPAPKGDELKANLKTAGLDALSAEGTVLHIHQHLDIVINGKAVGVPMNLGIGTDFISPLHVHDDSGVVHVESPVQKDFTLGQLFTEWGVPLTDTCDSTYCNDDTHKLVVAVNGQAIIGKPQDLVLKAHDEIEIWYGDKTLVPEFIKSYTFPEGE
jgi:hypothetical protein